MTTFAMPSFQIQRLKANEALSLFNSLTGEIITLRPSFCCLKFSNDNETIGMAIIDISFPHATYIDWIGIDARWQKQQIEPLILRAIESYSFQQGAYSISVQLPFAYPSLFDLSEQNYLELGFRQILKLPRPKESTIWQKLLSLDYFTWIDLTHELSSKIPSWDQCGFSMHSLLDYHQSPPPWQFKVEAMSSPLGIGTHLDAPKHCFDHGHEVNYFSLKYLRTACVVLDISQKAHSRYSLTVEDVKKFEGAFGNIEERTFIIVYTGWDRFWLYPEQYRNNYLYPSVSKEAAAYLLTKNIAGLGIDTLSPDRPEDGFPVHHLILGANKYLVENIANAARMPPKGGYVWISPLPIQNATESPVRLWGFF